MSHANDSIRPLDAALPLDASPRCALASDSGLCIWRVRYDSRFESSSGMQGYHIDHKDCIGLVATEAEHLGAVRAAICDHIGSRARLMALHEAHYLGCTLNDPNVHVRRAETKS